MLRWIKEHKIFTAVVSIAMILVIIISVSYFSGNGFIGRWLNGGYSAVSEPASDVTDGVKSGVKGIFGFRSIMRENEELRDEINALKREITDIRLTERELAEFRDLANALNYTDTADSYGHVTGKIIAADNSNYFSTFTINVGTESGIKEDDVVVSGNGLVGRISETGNGYSKVTAVIDDNINISFQVERNMSILGVVSGDGEGGIEGYTLDGDSGIVEGDTLLTTGIGMYPEGIEIGKATAVNYNSDTQLMSIEAEPAVNFKNLRKVMVLI